MHSQMWLTSAVVAGASDRGAHQVNGGATPSVGYPLSVGVFPAMAGATSWWPYSYIDGMRQEGRTAPVT